MKHRIGAAGLSTLLLAGCASTEGADYVARAPAEPLQSSKISSHEALDNRIAHYAKLNHLPESLVHAVVQRESKYNPALRHGPFWGLMQIRHATARSMGYTGAAKGLLDPETNLIYAVAYLANAYRVADGDARRAIRLYASGYYFEAKRKGLLGELRAADLSGELSDANPPVAGATEVAVSEAEIAK
jgi:soluble lytic murein transglycosylase-like protein